MAEEPKEHIFEAHSIKQSQFILSEAKITALITGIQWGKTSSGSIRQKRYMHSFTSKYDNFIVTAPSYKIMHQSTLPAFLKFMDGFGSYNKSEAVFEMNHGGRCFMRTETDPDSIVGITDVRHIWGDEAGKYGLYFWENMQSRASFRDCPITLTTSPYSMNWIYKEIVKPVKAGKRPDVLLIQARSDENPYFPKTEFERRKSTMDARRFNMLYGGTFDKMQGLVYDCYDEIENTCEPFDLPTGTKYYAGVDWGFRPDPFVIKVRAITPDGRHFSVSEFYKTGMTITDMVAIAKQKKQVFGIQSFFCDPSQPGSIEEFNRNGLSAIAADNEILTGVDLHYELIKSRKLKFFRGLNLYTIDEMDTYHWPEPEDLGPDDDSSKTKPVDQNNHTCDADRYVTKGTYRSGIRLIPKIPGDNKQEESTQARIQRLKRRTDSGQTENW